MALKVVCDHCKEPIFEVGYTLRGFDAQRIETGPVIGNAHLHWDCVPLYGRSTERAVSG